LVEHSLGKGEVISSILIIGSIKLRVVSAELRVAVMTSAMTGSWLIVKWVGIAVTASYFALLLVVFWRFRRRSSRLRAGVILPVVVVNFIDMGVADIFQSVSVTRACFVTASVIYLYGLAILARGLGQEGQRGLFKESAAEDYIQPLRLS
jgi:hypothetical protein